jgi:hypothetical protein
MEEGGRNGTGFNSGRFFRLTAGGQAIVESKMVAHGFGREVAFRPFPPVTAYQYRTFCNDHFSNLITTKNLSVNNIHFQFNFSERHD